MDTPTNESTLNIWKDVVKVYDEQQLNDIHNEFNIIRKMYLTNDSVFGVFTRSIDEHSVIIDFFHANEERCGRYPDFVHAFVKYSTSASQVWRNSPLVQFANAIKE